MSRKSRAIRVLALTPLLAAAVVLSVLAAAPVARAQGPEPAVSSALGTTPLFQGTARQNQAANVRPLNEDLRVLFDEMTLVQLVWEQTGYAKTLCAGYGLQNIQPVLSGPLVLIPNAGDLSAGGSNVAIKLSPDGEISFIPRLYGHKIRVPMDVGDKREGEEVLSLSLNEGTQLMAAGKLVWTAKDKGPYGNGHGLPGHIAACDPSFDESVHLKWEKSG